MGCDIHICTEVRINGKWETANKWESEKYEGEPDYLSVADEICDERNYNLFAILADVRNGRGFAGIKTGEGFIPICKPKGVPDDACEEYRAYVKQWAGDGHSHSWLTASELMAYDWTQTTELNGVINGKEYEEWSRWRRGLGKGPENYCGYVSGTAIKHVSNQEMDDRIGGGELPDGYYTSVKWNQKYYQCAKQFLSEAMPMMWRLGPPDDVRIVFFFDN